MQVKFRIVYVFSNFSTTNEKKLLRHCPYSVCFLRDIIFDQYYGAIGANIAIIEEYWNHVGHILTAILYAYDSQVIILGGSVSNTYPLIKTSIWKVLEGFNYSPTIKNLKLEVSGLEHVGVLGQQR